MSGLGVAVSPISSNFSLKPFLSVIVQLTEGTIVKNTYLGHTQWVQAVRWSTTNEYLFVSGAYDNHVKLWDYRSPKAPIFELIGHEDKVLACDWSNPKFILSGGSDNSVRVFKSKIAIGGQ